MLEPGWTVRILLFLLMAVHGGIHGLGFVKAFGFGEVPGLQREIGPGQGLLWLAAGLLLVTAAALLAWAPRLWWVPAVPGVVLSQILIVGVWQDARFGTVANLVILVPLVLTVADLRPSSLRSTYRRAVERELEGAVTAPAVVTEADLDGLPDAVGRYLRRVGVVGRPAVRSFRARFRARIRGGPDEPWMAGWAEQYGFFDPVARIFFMRATRAGVPVDVLHRYVGAAATMEARVAGLVTVMDVSGAELTRSETVTVLNDMFLFAPAALVDAPIEWEALGGGAVRATYRNAGHTVSAVARFDAGGDLVGFHSDDRSRWTGGEHRLLRWSTPVERYAELGGVRLPVEAEARWVEEDGKWTYARFILEEIEYGVGDAPR